MSGSVVTQRLPIKIEIKPCSGCRMCQMVCPVFHEGVVNLEKARIRVKDRYEELVSIPYICQLCESPDCVPACPTEALTQEESSGIIRVDDEACNGCLSCVEACPHDAIWYSEDLEKLYVCDRCDGDPTCVKFCTSGALTLEEAA